MKATERRAHACFDPDRHIPPIHPLFHSSDFLKLRHSRNKSEMEAGSCKENDTPWHFTVRTLSKSDRFRTRKHQNDNISSASILMFSRSKTLGLGCRSLYMILEAKLERVHHAKLNKCSIRSFPCYVIAAMLEDDNATSLSFDSLGIDCKPSIPFTSRRGNTQLL